MKEILLWLIFLTIGLMLVIFAINQLDKFEKNVELENERIKKEKFIEDVKNKFNKLCIRFDESIVEEVYNTCNMYEYDVNLMIAQIKVESNWNNNAVGASGELSLAQFMKNTAIDITKSLGLEYKKNMELNPNFALILYAKHMKDLLIKYNGDIQLALLGYNCGTGNVDYFLKCGYSVERIKKIIYENKVPYDDKVGKIYAII